MWKLALIKSRFRGVPVARNSSWLVARRGVMGGKVNLSPGVRKKRRKEENKKKKKRKTWRIENLKIWRKRKGLHVLTRCLGGLPYMYIFCSWSAPSGEAGGVDHAVGWCGDGGEAPAAPARAAPPAILPIAGRGGGEITFGTGSKLNSFPCQFPTTRPLHWFG